MRRVSPRNPGWLRAVLYALALHAAVIAVLVVGFRMARRNLPPPARVMSATVVREPLAEQLAQLKVKQEEERKQREAEQQRAQEERARQEAERKIQEEAQRKKQMAEAEKQKRDEQRKKEEKQRRQQAEQGLREQLAEEEKSRVATRDARLASEVEKYKATIAQRVSRHWMRPPASRKDLQCSVRVRQAPGGEVLHAAVVRSSGDTAFDHSVETAVYKASPLPAPENAEVFDRDIEFIFRPTD